MHHRPNITKNECSFKESQEGQKSLLEPRQGVFLYCDLNSKVHLISLNSSNIQ